MQVGDLAPTFANLYPEILDHLIEESEFREIIKAINDELITAFSPYGARAWIDTIMGVATFWLWDDLGLAGVKKRLDNVEKRIERWNRDVGIQEGVSIISLRRTAYLNVSVCNITWLYKSTYHSYSSIFKSQIPISASNLLQSDRDLTPETRMVAMAAMREQSNKHHTHSVPCNTSSRRSQADLLYERTPCNICLLYVLSFGALRLLARSFEPEQNMAFGAPLVFSFAITICRFAMAGYFVILVSPLIPVLVQHRKGTMVLYFLPRDWIFISKKLMCRFPQNA